MQFHLDGFRPGDPETSESSEPREQSRPLPPEVDVLIIGAGPTGLTLAAQLAAFPGITTRIVDEKAGRLRVGQADGIACRTMEMFEAFGFSGRVLKEAYWVNETSFWKPADADRDTIVRYGRIQDTEDDLSEFPHVILNQARVHDFYLDVMRNAPARLAPDYARRFVELTVSSDASSVAEGRGDGAPIPHHVTVTLEKIDEAHAGEIETVRARFVVGCDGARSGVRKSIGRALVGESANRAWGVMDVLMVTDFPDIRLKATIHSGREGSVLLIPREGGYLVRLYIELDKLDANERISSRNVTPEHLIEAAQRILRPYTLDVKEVAWWSVYEIGQRLCERFDDVVDAGNSAQVPRVFIAGDACHTHSPKAGQGMNVSMQDGFNLGWKLASVVLGRSLPSILHTYSDERQAVAQELIEFDGAFAKMFSAPPRDPSRSDREGIDPEEFQRYFVQQGRFTAGTATRYRTSSLCAAPTWQDLASGLVIGMRFHSAKVIRLADARPVHLGHTIEADGRWRLFAFASAEPPADPSSKIGRLCAFLANDATSPIHRYTPKGADIDARIDVRAVFQQGHRELAIERLPRFLLPTKGRYGLVDYEKMFCASTKNGPDIFDARGIDRQRGCIVIVRPDQYIAHVLPLEAHEELAAFFGGFMIPVA